MTLRPAFFLAAIFFLAAGSGAQATEAAARGPGFFGRALETLHLAPRDRQRPRDDRSSVRVKNLTLRMTLAPLPLALSETRQLKVTLTLSNRSRKVVRLEFPSTQRIEILLRESASGKLVTQWSEDQSFANEPAYVTVNPGERVEYNAAVSTRDLRAGQAYTVEAFFPNFDELRIQQPVVPEK